MITRRRLLAAVPAVLVASIPARAQRSAIVGAWVGAVDAHGATIKVLTAAPMIPVQLIVSSPAGPINQAVEADEHGVATFVVRALAPTTRYAYTVSTEGRPAIDGSFRTFADGPISFRAIFASCAATGSASPVFTAMRQTQPDLFIHMGDLHYENITRNDVQRFRRAYDMVVGSPSQGSLLRHVPTAYVWDDHDFGSNNSNRTSASRPAAQQAYRRYVPHYPLPDSSSIHHSFTVGRVRFLMLDTRSERSPDHLPEGRRTMLGPLQLAWLERELEAAQSAPLVVLVNSLPWITKANEATSDGWAKFARERRQIADAIVRHGLTRRLVMLSGDAHMLAMDDGTHSEYSTLAGSSSRGFVVAHAAPMDRRATKKGGPYTHGPAAQNGQFGVLDIRDEGGPITVHLQGMRGASMVPGMEMTLTV